MVARADLERSGEYSPMTLIELDGPAMRRSEVWPAEDMYGLPVLLALAAVLLLVRQRSPDETQEPGERPDEHPVGAR